MNQMNRRGFFARMAQITGVALVSPAILRTVFTSTAHAEQRRPARPGKAAAGGAMPMVEPSDATAKAVGYVTDHTKSPNSKGNHCATCGFYTKKEMHGGKEVGTCTIFQGKLVYANGFCNSWNKKA